MRTAGWAALLLVCAVGAGGCGREYRTEADRFANLTDWKGYDGGLVVCVSGAGGMMGEVGRIRQGLVEGGVQCAIESFEWSSGWVLADQGDIQANMEKARMLARRIARYQQEHPDCPVHLIGVSAGTGLIVWAVEDLCPEHRVENVFLIASSLSGTYDLSGALKNVSGRLYNHFSTVDLVLAILVPAAGTVDRKNGASGGLNGFQPPEGADDSTRALYTDKLLQVGWKASDMTLGHGGDHLGGTQAAYVRETIASLAWARKPAEAAPSGELAAVRRPATTQAVAAPVKDAAPTGRMAGRGTDSGRAIAATPAVALAVSGGN